MLHNTYFLVFILLFVRCREGSDTNSPDVPTPVSGKWQIADKSVDLTSGAFGTLLAGAASQWSLNPNVGGGNSWGSQMIYEFNNDGTYKVYYRALATFITMQSFMEVVEQGTFIVEENLLHLEPTEYSGEGYFGHVSNKQPIIVDQLPQRTYQWVSDKDHLILYGYCGEFQIEPYSENNKQKQDIIAAFTRVE